MRDWIEEIPGRRDTMIPGNQDRTIQTGLSLHTMVDVEDSSQDSTIRTMSRHSRIVGDYSRISGSPRCKAIFSDGRTCKKPAFRLNHRRTPKEYTDHCAIHGGQKERATYLRRKAEAEMKPARRATEDAIASTLGVSTQAPTESIPHTRIHLAGNQQRIDSRASLHSTDRLQAPDDKHEAPISSISSHPSTRPQAPSTVETSDARPNPKAGGGDTFYDTTSTGLSNGLSNGLSTLEGRVPEKVESENLGELEKSSPEESSSSSEGRGLENKASRNFSTSPDGELYTIPDKTLQKSFLRKLQHGGAHSLNEELALTRALIQQILTGMSSKDMKAEELSKLTKLMAQADKLLNTVHRIEADRAVQYTRESLRIDVLKVAAAIKRVVPEEDRRRVLATELARILGPTLADTGDIVYSREVVRRG